MTVTLRRVRADDGMLLRALRLESLSDPLARIAFVSTYEDEAAQPEEFWHDRAATAARGETVNHVIAFDGETPVGQVVALLETPGADDWAGRPIEAVQVHLVGVYVAPSHRGSGLLARLVEDQLAWGRERGVARMRLYVHTDNVRAQAAYGKLGFMPTGVTAEVAAGTELEMVRRLDP
jgi:GNAT superfamily N-acetyltransferase